MYLLYMVSWLLRIFQYIMYVKYSVLSPNRRILDVLVLGDIKSTKTK